MSEKVRADNACDGNKNEKTPPKKLISKKILAA